MAKVRLEHCNRHFDWMNVFSIKGYHGYDLTYLYLGNCTHCMKRVVAYQQMNFEGEILTPNGFQVCDKKTSDNYLALIDNGRAAPTFVDPFQDDTRGRPIGQGEYTQRAANADLRGYILRIARITDGRRADRRNTSRRRGKQHEKPTGGSSGSLRTEREPDHPQRTSPAL